MADDGAGALRLTLIATAGPARPNPVRFGADAACSATALRRIARSARRTAGFEQILRSPAHGAFETAEALGLGAAATDQRLRDRDYGAWSGRTLASVVDDDSAAFQRLLTDPSAAPPGGESVDDLVARAALWLDGLSPAVGQCLAITHPPVIRACIVAALGAASAAWFRLDVAHGTRSALTRTGSTWRVALVAGAL